MSRYGVDLSWIPDATTVAAGIALGVMALWSLVDRVRSHPG